jgi:hypothetical protein
LFTALDSEASEFSGQIRTVKITMSRSRMPSLYPLYAIIYD